MVTPDDASVAAMSCTLSWGTPLSMKRSFVALVHCAKHSGWPGWPSAPGPRIWTMYEVKLALVSGYLVTEPDSGGTRHEGTLSHPTCVDATPRESAATLVSKLLQPLAFGASISTGASACRRDQRLTWGGGLGFGLEARKTFTAD